jgi:hypothetical protein
MLRDGHSFAETSPNRLNYRGSILYWATPVISHSYPSAVLFFDFINESICQVQQIVLQWKLV